MKLFNTIFTYLYEPLKNPLRIVSLCILSLFLFYLSLVTPFTIHTASLMLDFMLFPFIKTASFIKLIALRGAFGNVCGILIWVLIAFIPLILYGLVQFHRKRKIRFTILFYVGISIINLITLYFFINPGVIPFNSLIYQLPEPQFSDTMNVFQNTYLFGFELILINGALLYIVGIIMRAIRHRRFHLEMITSILLTLCQFIYFLIYLSFVYFLPWFYRISFLQSTKSNGILLTMQVVSTYIQIILFVVILRLFIRLLNLFKQGQLFSQENIHTLYQLAKWTLWMVVCSIVNQLFQVIYQMSIIHELQSFQFNFALPISKLVLSFVFYLLALYMESAYKLYKENQLTI